MVFAACVCQQGMYHICVNLATSQVLASDPTTSSRRTISIAATDLPTPSSQQRSKLKSLFLRAMEKKPVSLCQALIHMLCSPFFFAQDRLRFSASCFTRASVGPPDPSWCKMTWNSLVQCTQDVAAEISLNFLIEG